MITTTSANRTENREIAALTLGAARPLIWHDRTESSPKRLRGATCFFLRFETQVVGVTADHVVKAYLSAVAENPATVCQLRTSQPFDLAAAIIARNEAQDVATFAVSEETLQETEAVALDCRGNWPPPKPHKCSAVSACGFPESTREVFRDSSAAFNAWGALAKVEDVTDREIVVVFDESAEATSGGPPVPPIGFNLSGCSGGPVLLHGIRNGLHRWFPVGLISAGPVGEAKEGESAMFDVIRFRRIHWIQLDGTLTDPHGGTGWLPR